MSKYGYAHQGYDASMARTVGRDLDISFKQAIEITREIRNKDIEAAKAYLERVIAMKEPVRFKRFTNGLGHKPGMASGRYPIRACKAILTLVKEAEANAQTKGLGDCTIIHAMAQKAHRPMHMGRHPRLKMKRAHVEIVVKETEKAMKKTEKKAEKKTEKKADKAEKESAKGDHA